jgi:hypothetical protein
MFTVTKCVSKRGSKLNPKNFMRFALGQKSGNGQHVFSILIDYRGHHRKGVAIWNAI